MLTLMSGACASFGRTPRGERLERIKNSPNYHDGRFQNLSPPSPALPGAPKRPGFFGFLFRSREGLRPRTALPTVKTDLRGFDRDEDVLVWLGHSSCFIQTDGMRIVIDPVLVKGAPVYFANKFFKGTGIYKPDDLPDIDYLLITHDHWDHLDYDTVKQIRDRVGKVICALGVGEHLEYWGLSKDRIIELDWNESAHLEGGFTVHCLPARHFSGRGLFSRNTTLWASFMLQTPERNIFISGDGGYDSHFAEIGRRFEIDLALLENGQYNPAWHNSHLLPDEVVRAARDLRAKKLLTVHNSKFTLSTHPWEEPLVNISQADEEESLNLVTPMIGEPVYLDERDQTFSKWWEGAGQKLP
ncbi:MAG: MBL fold metallo-hydrolase [Spirochaetaceae bacterium]|nr:MBL fold metallo-hydrolase [Spirochaetaceae bacterium]